MFDRSMIVKSVPKYIVERTRVNYDRYELGLYDAFQEAVRSYGKRASYDLRQAFYHDDFRDYIPSAYLAKYLPEHLKKYAADWR